jgi:PAS domain S-box-containing protein
MTLPLDQPTLLLSVLLSVTAVVIPLLILKIRTLTKERDVAREKNEADSKILFLKSRYASMGETVGNIAHQWKQPLNAIGSIQNSIKASLLFKGEISNEKLLDSVEKSFKLLKHLGETIDTFYSFLSQRNNEESSFTVSDELEAIRKITEYSFQNSRIRLDFLLDANPMIQGNPNEFTHALLNLILNAKDAFDNHECDAPAITVRVMEGDEICTITISDNAGGIRVEPIEMVFDLHISTKEEGSGLGLFMTKNIIEQRFGGTIGVENQNGGACFTITLPYAQYGEHFSPESASDEKLTLERINRLTQKIIELEELEKTLRKWADIFKHAHWAIAIHVEMNTTFEITNEAFKTLYGYSEEEYKTVFIPDLFTSESLLLLPDIQKEAYEKGYVAFESTHKRKDGSTFPVSIEFMNVKNEEGESLYHIANIWDISEKKAAQELLLLQKFALDQINEAVFLIDEHSLFHYVNETACSILGYTKSELLSMGVPDLDSDFPMELWKIHWEDIKKEKTTLTLTQHRRKDGSIFPIEISSNYFEYNGVGYSLAVSRDITERLLLEEQKESERRERELRALADTSPGMMGAYHMRPDGSVCMPYTSPNIHELFGITPEEIKEDATPLMALTHPDDVEIVIQTIQESAQTMSLWHIEYRIIHPTKGIRWMEGNTMPQPHPDGGTVWYGYVHDITERKRIEKELEESHAFLTKLIDSLPDPIFVKDRDHRWLILNKANYEFAGIEEGSLIGQSDYDFFPKEEADIFWEKDEEVFNSGNVNINEEYFTSSDGVEHYIQTIKAMFVGSDGKEYLVGTIRDLSERKKMEDDLRNALEFNEGIIGAIPDLLFEIAPDGTYMGVWAQNQELLAAQKELLLGKNFKEILPPDVVITSLQAMKEVDETGASLGKTYSLNLSEKKRWFELSVSRKKSSGNYIVLSRDVTERKIAEEAVKELNATLEEKVKERTLQLQQTLEFNEGVINALPDLLFEIDRNGVYLNIWARDEELLAAQKELLLGNSLYDVLSEEAANTVMAGLKESEAKGSSYDKTIKIDLPQGSRYFELSVSKKASSNTYIVLSRDITERKKAEEALAKSEETFRSKTQHLKSL